MLIRWSLGSTTKQEIRERLKQKNYGPHYIIFLDCNGGAFLPLVVMVLPSTKQSQQVLTAHEPLGLPI
nr:unnamed protein product [Callosobruchus chinensis]